jgi:hypothetical protein
MLLDTLNWGSRRCLLTWKVKDISPRFSILELWPKMLPIEECGSGLWLTPSTVQIEPKEGRREKRKAYRESIGRKDYPGCLAEQVATPEMWPTPTQDSATEREKKYAQGGTPLTMAVKMWPTPNARDWKDSGENVNWEKVAKKGKLAGVVMWPTPVSSEARQGFQDRSRGKKGSQESLTTVVVKQEGGRDAVQGSLNPDWVEHYLMGYPLGWTNLTSQESE